MPHLIESHAAFDAHGLRFRLECDLERIGDGHHRQFGQRRHGKTIPAFPHPVQRLAHALHLLPVHLGRPDDMQRKGVEGCIGSGA